MHEEIDLAPLDAGTDADEWEDEEAGEATGDAAAGALLSELVVVLTGDEVRTEVRRKLEVGVTIVAEPRVVAFPKLSVIVAVMQVGHVRMGATEQRDVDAALALVLGL